MILILNEDFGRRLENEIPNAHGKSEQDGERHGHEVDIIHLRAGLHGQICRLSDRDYKDEHKEEENKEILEVGGVDEVVLISVVRMSFVAQLPAFFQYGFVLLFAHTFL